MSVHEKLHTLMFGLIYPAVLGSALVAILQYPSRPDPQLHFLQDPAMYLGVTYCLYFCASFVASFKPPRYRLPAFVLDAVEVVLMYAGFFLLGILGDFDDKIGIHWAYGVFLVSVFVQIGWLAAAGKNPLIRWPFRLVASALLVLGMVLPATNYIAHAGVALSLIALIVVHMVLSMIEATPLIGSSAFGGPSGEEGKFEAKQGASKPVHENEEGSSVQEDRPGETSSPASPGDA